MGTARTDNYAPDTWLRMDLYGYAALTDRLGLHLQLTGAHGEGHRAFSTGALRVDPWAITYADDVVFESQTAFVLHAPLVGVHGLFEPWDMTVPVAVTVAAPLHGEDPIHDDIRRDTENMRLTDLVTGSGVLWIRFTAAPSLDLGRTHLRSDWGVDVPVDDWYPVLWRVNLALGHALGPVAVMAEMGAVGEFDSTPDNTISLAAGARYLDLLLRPGLHVVLPLERYVGYGVDAPPWWVLSFDWVHD